MPLSRVWDVVRVPFPYTSRPITQRRPALVVGQHAHAGSPHLLWLLMITSASHRPWVGDIEILDLEAAGLPAASMIRSAKIATLEAGSVEPLGRLAPGARDAVTSCLTQILAGSPAAPPG